MKKIGIYLAGKIESNGWRQHIIDIRNTFCGDDYEPSTKSINKLKNAYVDVDEKCYVTGPFFLSCDHSCYHGDGSHGLGKGNEYNCYGYSRCFLPNEVIEICTEQIRRADIIIAYIDDITCYGTLFELGLAKQMGKTIVTIFDTKKRENDMWFIAMNSDYSTNLENIKNKQDNNLKFCKINDDDKKVVIMTIINKLIDYKSFKIKSRIVQEIPIFMDF